MKVLLPDGFRYHAAQVFLVHLLGEHGLMDGAVEAAKLEPHSWQAAKLRSVDGALGRVSEERRRCPVFPAPVSRGFVHEEVVGYSLRLGYMARRFVHEKVVGYSLRVA